MLDPNGPMLLASGARTKTIPRLPLFMGVLAAILVALAILRPVDHDESQYVAAATLTARGLLPYRDYAYLQTPLQPFLLAPLVHMAGVWAWPALRVVNALFAAIAITCVAAAARARGASVRAALLAAVLMSVTDILLFSAGTARNDALPAALLSIALWLAVRAELPGRNSRWSALLVGFLLAAATATKLSYALPAGAYWLAVVFDRRRRPVEVALGAVPILVFLAWTAAQSPVGFAFGIFRFPVQAPTEYYTATHRVWRLTSAAKALDMVKFLALGPALLAFLVVGATRLKHRPAMLDGLILAGLLAAVMPTPTWRQYWLPMLPPLFILLAQVWTQRTPRKWERIVAVVFACAGLAPTIEALDDGPGLRQAMTESRAIGEALDRAGLARNIPVSTLSPQFLPAAHRVADPRFATGPFYFRSETLLDTAAERQLRLVSQARLPAEGPAIVLVGGEDDWTSGNGKLDARMEGWAIRTGLRRIDLPGSAFRLYARR